MKHETAGDNVATLPGRQPRCACCNGVIEISPDRDNSLGLNLALGLVSDECALICDGCTSNLIAAREAQKSLERRRA